MADMKARLMERFNAEVNARVESILAAMLGSPETDNGSTPFASQKRNVTDVMDQIAENDRTDPIVRRRSRRGQRAKVAYALMPVRKGHRRVTPDFGGFETASKVYAAIKADGPLTNYQIEQKTGLVKKTVESCVFFLRRSKLIQSQPIASE